jgi:hypothetical protein
MQIFSLDNEMYILRYCEHLIRQITPSMSTQSLSRLLYCEISENSINSINRFPLRLLWPLNNGKYYAGLSERSNYF